MLDVVAPDQHELSASVHGMGVEHAEPGLAAPPAAEADARPGHETAADEPEECDQAENDAEGEKHLRHERHLCAEQRVENIHRYAFLNGRPDRVLQGGRTRALSARGTHRLRG